MLLLTDFRLKNVVQACSAGSNSLPLFKGYYSAANVHAAFAAGVCEVGIQCPGNVKLKGAVDEVLAKTLRDRRAGIELLIGHVKQISLKRSRMKSDSSLLGFWVSVRPWVQFETISQPPDQGLGKSGIGILGILIFKVTPTDPSVVPLSGYVTGA
jgi:hypothetical protein